MNAMVVSTVRTVERETRGTTVDGNVGNVYVSDSTREILHRTEINTSSNIYIYFKIKNDPFSFKIFLKLGITKIVKKP